MLRTDKIFWLVILSFVVAGSLTIPAHAGVISQFTELSRFQRSCPGLSDPNFINNWGAAIKSIYAADTIRTDIACHFNSSFQKSFYNTDGSPKRGGLPSGVPYTLAEVGTSQGELVFGGTSSEIGSIDGDYYGRVKLDAGNLGLPEIKIKSSSNALQRNSVNGFAATAYKWLGEAKTLSYSVNFDFFNSYILWGIPGAAEVHNYAFGLTFGVSHNMAFAESEPFNFNFGQVLTTAEFLSHTMAMIESDEDHPFTGSLTINFEVAPGDKFWLWTQVQAFGLNGGFVDASHTVTSALGVQGFSQEQSLLLFANDLRQLTNQIPSPSTLILLLSTWLLLCTRWRIKIAK